MRSSNFEDEAKREKVPAEARTAPQLLRVFMSFWGSAKTVPIDSSDISLVVDAPSQPACADFGPRPALVQPQFFFGNKKRGGSRCCRLQEFLRRPQEA